MEESQKKQIEQFYDDFLLNNRNKIRLAGPKHGIVKFIESLRKNTRPNPKKLFINEGYFGSEKALQADVAIETLIFCQEYLKSPESIILIGQLADQAEQVYSVSQKVFQKLCERNQADGILTICALPNHSFDSISLNKDNLIIILDGLEIPGNIGTIIRAVDGIGGDGIILCNRRARLTHPKLIKSSQGSNFTVPVFESDIKETIQWLGKNHFQIFLADTHAEQNYFEPDYKGRVALVAGSERYGISGEWYETSHRLIKIPMFGNCDSLNVAIATSILLFEIGLKQRDLLNR